MAVFIHCKWLVILFFFSFFFGGGGGGGHPLICSDTKELSFTFPFWPSTCFTSDQNWLLLSGLVKAEILAFCWRYWHCHTVEEKSQCYQWKRKVWDHSVEMTQDCEADTVIVYSTNICPPLPPKLCHKMSAFVCYTARTCFFPSSELDTVVCANVKWWTFFPSNNASIFSHTITARSVKLCDNMYWELYVDLIFSLIFIVTFTGETPPPPSYT